MNDLMKRMAEDARNKEQKVFDNMDEKKFHSVAMLAQKQVELEFEISAKEESIKLLKKDLYKLSTETIPSEMMELGIKAFEMDTGEMLSVINQVTASITAKNKEAAHKWLVKHGHGDLIKHTVTTKFSMGEEDEAKEFVTELNDKGMNYDIKQAVHAMTLKAFVREQIEKGNPLDTDLLGVFEFKTTKIKRR